MMSFDKILKNFAALIILISLLTIIVSAENNQQNININVRPNITKNQPQPIIKFTILNDNITNTADGIMMIFVENPSSNALNVDVSIIGPNGIYFSSNIFQPDNERSVIGGNFIVQSGQQRTIFLNAKSNNIGTFRVQYKVEYYSEIDTASKTIYLEHTFIVKEKSPNFIDKFFNIFSTIEKPLKILS